MVLCFRMQIPVWMVASFLVAPMARSQEGGGESGAAEGATEGPSQEVPGKTGRDEKGDTSESAETLESLIASLSPKDIRSGLDIERRVARLALSLDDEGRTQAYQRFGERLAQLGPEWCQAPGALESLLIEERVAPKVLPPDKEMPLPRVSPSLFGLDDASGGVVIDGNLAVSSDKQVFFPLHPGGVEMQVPPWVDHGFDDWAKHWRRIEHNWDLVEKQSAAQGWLAPLKVQRAPYEIAEIEDAGDEVRPLTAAGRPFEVDITLEGELTARWGGRVLVQTRVAQWRMCEEREKDCFRQPPNWLEAWLWQGFIYVSGLVGDAHTESALMPFTPPPEMPQPLIACRAGRYLGLSHRAKALLESRRASVPPSIASETVSDRAYEVQGTLESIAKAMAAKDAKALRPLLTSLGKAAARPRDMFASAWLAWLDVARRHQLEQEKEVKRVLAAVPKHAATCKAQLAAYERAEEAERKASAAGQVAVAMAKAKAKQSAATAICQASRGLEEAVELYKELRMSDSADAVRRAHRFCFNICR